MEEEGGTLIARKVGEAVQNTLGAVVGAIDIPLGEHLICLRYQSSADQHHLYLKTKCVLSSSSRPGEGRSPPGLLGPRSGHPLLQRVPAGVLPPSLHPPLSRLRPGRVRRLLPGATRRALPRLGPPGEGVQRLQSETRGALAGRGAGTEGGRRAEPPRKLELTMF